MAKKTSFYNFSNILLIIIYKISLSLADFHYECRNFDEQDDKFVVQELYLCQRYLHTLWFKPLFIMKVFKFKTNINCGSCIDRVASYLDNTSDIAYWQVDTEDADKVLTVEGGEHLARRDVVDIVNLAGFAAYPVKKNLLNKLIGVLA